MIKINIASVLVDDQAKAEAFYVDVLGFVKKHDVPAGGARWLTVANADGSGSNFCWSRWDTTSRGPIRRPCSTRVFPSHPWDATTSAPSMSA